MGTLSHLGRRPRARAPGSRTALLAIGLALDSGCSDDERFVTTRGRYVDLELVSTETPCAGTSAYLDAAFASYARSMGLSPDDASRVRFRISQRATNEACSPTSRACAHPGVAVSDSVFAVHELAHLAHFEINERSNVFLAEGFATALSEPGYGSPLYGIDETFWSSILGTASFQIDYRAAADFAAFLLVTYDASTIHDLFAAMPIDPSRAEFESVLEATLGNTLSEILAERAAYGKEGLTGVRAAQPECELPSDPWSDDGTHVVIDFACEDPHVFGTVQSLKRRAYRRFALGHEGDYVIVSRDASRSGWSIDDLLSPCGVVTARSETRGPNPTSDGPSLTFVRRDAGDHVIWAQRYDSPGATFDIAYVDPSSPVPLPDDIDRILVAGRPGETVRAHFTTTAALEVTHTHWAAETTTTLCSDSGSGPTCVFVDPFDGSSIAVPAGDHVITSSFRDEHTAGVVAFRFIR